MTRYAVYRAYDAAGELLSHRLIPAERIDGVLHVRLDDVHRLAGYTPATA